MGRAKRESGGSAGATPARADTHPERVCRCRRCKRRFVARQNRRLCDDCHREKRRSDWRRYAKKRYKIEKNGLRELAALGRMATEEAKQAARAKAKAEAAARRAARKEAAAARKAEAARRREEARAAMMKDVRRCKFCGTIAYGQDFCRSCMRDGFNNVYLVTGRSNGWERREASQEAKSASDGGESETEQPKGGVK